jgi:ubiquinone/menaquinone biosynthesis C-methylase UbiE
LRTQYVGSVTDQFAAEAVYWDQAYRGSDVRSLIYKQRQETALRWVDDLGIRPGARALDIGSGAGHATIALARRGYSVDAVDVTQPMLALVLKNATAAGVAERVSTQLGEAHALSFADSSFDLVIGLGLLPWIEEPALVLAEMRRVLRPRGYLIVSTANRWKLTYRLDPLFSQDLLPIKRPIRALIERAGYWPTTGPQSFLQSLEQTDRLIAQAGLERQASRTLGFGPFTFLGRTVLPARAGAKLHLLLQQWADRGLRGLDGAGTEYLILARRVRPQ